MPILWPSGDYPPPQASGDVARRLRAIVESWKIPRGGSVYYAELPMEGEIVTVGIVFDVSGMGRGWIQYRVTSRLVLFAAPDALESWLRGVFSDQVRRLIREEVGIDSREYRSAWLAWLKGRATPEQIRLLDRANEFGADDLGLPSARWTCRICGMTGATHFTKGLHASLRYPGEDVCDRCLLAMPAPAVIAPPLPKPESWRDRMLRDPTCTEPMR